MGESYLTIASEEIECAHRIVYETGIYKADVVSTRASEFFFIYIEIWKLTWLILLIN